MDTVAPIADQYQQGSILGPNNVAQKSRAILNAEEDWQKIDALMGGTGAMRKAGVLFLPKWPQEMPESYSFRLMSTTLFNAFARTLGNLAGKPFKEPLVYKDLPPEVESWLDNADLAGQNLHALAQEMFTAALQYGLTHVLVDYPPVVGARTLADETALGARPYLVHIKAPSVLGWRSERIKGLETLTMLRFMEWVTVNDGAFNSKEVEQVRVLTPGAWATYRKDDKNDWIAHESGTTSVNFIPVVTFYTARTGFMTAIPPLLDIAELNIEHWQSSSDQRNILHVARVPILTLIGLSDDSGPIQVGANTSINIPLGGDAKFVEHSGKAIDAGNQDLKDIEERMRQLGAEILIKGPGRMTATQAALDTAQQQNYLSALAERFEDFLDEVVAVMAAWRNIPITGDIEVFSDFGIADFDNAAETLLLNAVTAGMISRETFFDELKRRGTLSADADWTIEDARIRDQGMSLVAPSSGGFNAPNPNAVDTAGGAGGGDPGGN